MDSNQLRYKVASTKGQHPDCIVVLKIPPDALTNETGRQHICCETTAKYRANKAEVVRIYCPVKQKEYTTARSCFSPSGTNPLTYTVGNTCEVQDYDENPDAICSTGIHYSKSVRGLLLRADKYSNFYECGMPYYQQDLLAGYKHGYKRRWYHSGQIELLCQYDMGKKDGIKMRWWPNGQLRYQLSYRKGKPIGLYRECEDDGRLVLECDTGELKKRL